MNAILIVDVKARILIVGIMNDLKDARRAMRRLNTEDSLSKLMTPSGLG